MPATTVEFARLSRIVAARLGRQFGESRPDLLVGALADRLSATSRSVSEYLYALEAEDLQELGELAARLTVTETYFFRHAEQCQAIAEFALPERLSSGRRPVRVLSAGCASGEEAYSLAILGHTLADGAVEVVGWDIHPGALGRAREGLYSEWSLRETPANVRARCFERQGRFWRVADRWRTGVSFVQQNLLQAPPAEPAHFDLILCRNVLMYFSPEQAQAVLRGLARILTPGGWLFLGPVENAREIDELELCNSHGAYYYRRRGGGTVPTWTRAVAPQPAAASMQAPAPDWFAAIADASARIARLAASPPPASRPVLDAGLLDTILLLVREERYGEGLAHLAELPAALADDAQVLELRAVLQTDTGDQAGAEATCRQLLAIDPRHAGACYLLALAREQAGDPVAAVALDRESAVLWPGFAMPHVHLGLLARRAGDLPASAAAFRRAEQLLPGDDERRLQLYGGGFGRAALVALCRGQQRTR